MVLTERRIGASGGARGKAPGTKVGTGTTRTGKRAAAAKGEIPASTAAISAGIGALLAFVLGFVVVNLWTPGEEEEYGAEPPAPARVASEVMPPAPELWVDARGPLLAPLQANVSCAPGGARAGSCGEPRNADRCARFVLDGAVPEEDVQKLRHLVQWLVDEAWGAGAGPPSVIDLHQGSISYKEQFVELGKLMEFKSLHFTQEQVKAYKRVRMRVREALAGLFGVPAKALLHDLTFFSHINASKEARTLHDEYWHQHVDTLQYGTFAYTSLLYLSTQGEDFDGGEFVFDTNGGTAVQPRVGRLVVFSSDAENPHRVEKVSRGARITLTAAFTCNIEQALSIGKFPRPGLGTEADMAAVASEEEEGADAAASPSTDSVV